MQLIIYALALINLRDQPTRGVKYFELGQLARTVHISDIPRTNFLRKASNIVLSLK